MKTAIIAIVAAATAPAPKQAADTARDMGNSASLTPKDPP